MNSFGRGHSDLKSSPIVESLDRSGRGLGVMFQWHEDRLAHLVSLIDGSRRIPLLASLEGKEQEPWPSSPPLQDLNVERREVNQYVILAVGMAGNSHWSMSAAAKQGDVAAEDNQPEIVWDVACRLKLTPDVLSSSYRSMVLPRVVDSQNAIFEISNMTCRLSAVTLAGQPETEIKTLADGLSIQTAKVAGPLPKTVQWQYRLRLE